MTGTQVYNSPIEANEAVVTEAQIKAGRKYLLGFGIDDLDDDEIRGLALAMRSAAPSNGDGLGIEESTDAQAAG